MTQKGTASNPGRFTTLHRLAHAGKSPIEPVWVTPSVRRYRIADIERLAGWTDQEQAA